MNLFEINASAGTDITPSQNASNKYLDLKEAHHATIKAMLEHGKGSEQHKASMNDYNKAANAHEEATSKLNNAEKHMHVMGINQGWHNRTVSK